MCLVDKYNKGKRRRQGKWNKEAGLNKLKDKKERREESN